MSRFTEGSIFDHTGIWRAAGYLQTCPPGVAPWLSIDADGLAFDRAALEAAPHYEKSYLIFFNGNLHNYYHWVTEGLLCLDVLSQTMGPAASINIALPKSMDIAAMLDHRASLGAVGLDRYDVVEVPQGLIKVREAIWVDNELVQCMPAPYVKDFQRRVSARYASVRGPRSRRLFVDRKGPTRKIANVEQVKALLARYDFETVYLEGMQVVDQIMLFQSAEFVIGVHGAGLSNLLFCEPGTKVIELMPDTEMRSFFWLICEKLGLVHGMQFCSLVGDQGERAPFHSSVVVDTEKLQALFRMVDAHS